MFFIPLAFDTFGFLATEAVNFLTRVQRVIHSNVSTPKGQDFVFSRLGFAIQKGCAAPPRKFQVAFSLVITHIRNRVHCRSNTNHIL
ncbi:hypothetical protein QVD17_26644 [Tagetes erecta]|uniref:Uncharacterized protein n=1 Tax=Tagetes erecta TaxID=13708 RepID=A0AAD8K6Y6_TARER|nr:hypothetical protein QVD17_26644 [Tagetes erecta]